MYKEIINQTFNSVFQEKETLVKVLSVYVVILMALEFINIDNIAVIEGKIHIQNVYILYLNLIVSTICSVLISVSTYRVLILGKKSIPALGLFKFTSREFSFLFQSIKLVLIIGSFAVIAMIISKLFGNAVFLTAILLVTLISTIIISRISLVFPSISIDKKMTFKESWHLTKDYKLLTFFMIVLFPIVFSSVMGIVYGLVIKFLVSAVHPVFSILTPVLNVFIVVFIVSALSAAYRYIVNNGKELSGNYPTDDKLIEKEYANDDMDEITEKINDHNHEVIEKPAIAEESNLTYKRATMQKDVAKQPFIRTNNRKSFLRPAIAGIALMFLTYMVYDKYFSYEPELKDIYRLISKDKKMYNNLREVQYKKEDYKAVAFGLNSEGYYVYWYTYGMPSQQIANKIALKKCNEAGVKLGVGEKCKLFNEVLSQI